MSKATALPIKTNDPVILVGGGSVSLAHLAAFGGNAVNTNDNAALPLVAADSGADALAAASLIPQAVIGDLDSISPATRASLPPEILHHTPDQSRTDFAKALDAIHAPLVIGLGFLGKRLDHSLAALAALAQYPRPALLYGAHETVFCVGGDGGEVVLELGEGARVSVWPLAEQEFISSKGLEFPLRGLTLAPGGRHGTSNRVNAQDGRVVITPAREGGDRNGGGGFAVMLEARHCLAAIHHIAPDMVARLKPFL